MMKQHAYGKKEKLKKKSDLNAFQAIRNVSEL